MVNFPKLCSRQQLMSKYLNKWRNTVIYFVVFLASQNACALSDNDSSLRFSETSPNTVEAERRTRAADVNKIERDLKALAATADSINDTLEGSENAVASVEFDPLTSLEEQQRKQAELNAIDHATESKEKADTLQEEEKREIRHNERHEESKQREAKLLARTEAEDLEEALESAEDENNEELYGEMVNEAKDKVKGIMRTEMENELSDDLQHEEAAELESAVADRQEKAILEDQMKVSSEAAAETAAKQKNTKKELEHSQGLEAQKEMEVRLHNQAVEAVPIGEVSKKCGFREIKPHFFTNIRGSEGPESTAPETDMEKAEEAEREAVNEAKESKEEETELENKDPFGGDQISNWLYVTLGIPAAMTGIFTSLVFFV